VLRSKRGPQNKNILRAALVTSQAGRRRGGISKSGHAKKGSPTKKNEKKGREKNQWATKGKEWGGAAALDSPTRLARLKLHPQNIQKKKGRKRTTSDTPGDEETDEENYRHGMKTPTTGPPSLRADTARRKNAGRGPQCAQKTLLGTWCIEVDAWRKLPPTSGPPQQKGKEMMWRWESCGNPKAVRRGGGGGGGWFCWCGEGGRLGKNTRIQRNTRMCLRNELDLSS